MSPTVSVCFWRLSLGAGLGARTAAGQGITFDQAPLTLFTQNGRHEFIVDVADNISRTELGLRYRHSVDPDGGLLILQSLAAPSQLQVDDRRAVASHRSSLRRQRRHGQRGTPLGSHGFSTPITPTRPVAAALELAGGTITRYGILPGDQVIGGGLGQSR